jgi:hypothetical protein
MPITREITKQTILKLYRIIQLWYYRDPNVWRSRKNKWRRQKCASSEQSQDTEWRIINIKKVLDRRTYIYIYNYNNKNSLSKINASIFGKNAWKPNYSAASSISATGKKMPGTSDKSTVITGTGTYQELNVQLWWWWWWWRFYILLFKDTQKYEKALGEIFN